MLTENKAAHINIHKSSKPCELTTTANQIPDTSVMQLQISTLNVKISLNFN